MDAGKKSNADGAMASSDKILSASFCLSNEDWGINNDGYRWSLSVIVKHGQLVIAVELVENRPSATSMMMITVKPQVGREVLPVLYVGDKGRRWKYLTSTSNV